MAYTFAVNVENMGTLAKSLDTEAKKIEGDIPEIYTKIGNMESDGNWRGDSYQAFVSGTNGYKAALETLPKVIMVFSNMLTNELKTGAETAVKEICNAINSINGE